MENYPDIGLNSYDRLFPNQDTLPKGGFGNLIALPLQKKARNSDNSVFVDENWVVYPDQWAFLAGIQKIDRSTIEMIVERADAKGRTIGVRLDVSEEENPTPWKISPSRNLVAVAEPVPENIHIVIGNEIYIEKAVLSPSLRGITPLL